MCNSFKGVDLGYWRQLFQMAFVQFISSKLISDQAFMLFAVGYAADTGTSKKIRQV